MSFIQIARDLCGTRRDRQALHRPIAPVGHSWRVPISKSPRERRNFL